MTLPSVCSVFSAVNLLPSSIHSISQSDSGQRLEFGLQGLHPKCEYLHTPNRTLWYRFPLRSVPSELVSETSFALDSRPFMTATLSSLTGRTLLTLFAISSKQWLTRNLPRLNFSPVSSRRFWYLKPMAEFTQCYIRYS